MNVIFSPTFEYIVSLWDGRLIESIDGCQTKVTSHISWKLQVNISELFPTRWKSSFYKNYELVEISLQNPKIGIDHNMLDTALLDGISENWAHCLKKLVIDVRASYRNIRYQFFGRRTEALEWAKFNENCTKCGVQVNFGSTGPLSRWRHDIFCDHYENVSTVHVLLRLVENNSSNDFKVFKVFSPFDCKVSFHRQK